MAAILAISKTIDSIAAISYILSAGCYKAVSSRPCTTVILSDRSLAQLSAHIRFAQLFYGSGLICISAFDVSFDTTAIVYVYTVGEQAHLSIISLVSATTALSIEDLFLNASWYERETAEMLGITFVGSRDGRGLLLPYNSTLCPIKKIMPSNSTSTQGHFRCSEALAFFQI